MAASRSTGSRIENGAGGQTRARRFPAHIPQAETAALAGAIAELLVSNALLARGWHVYRAVCQSAPFDLVAAIGGDLYRVEVKSVRPLANGELVYSARNALDPRRYDILAEVVSGTETIIFTPPLDEVAAVAAARAAGKER